MIGTRKEPFNANKELDARLALADEEAIWTGLQADPGYQCMCAEFAQAEKDAIEELINADPADIAQGAELRQEIRLARRVQSFAKDKLTPVREDLYAPGTIAD